MTCCVAIKVPGHGAVLACDSRVLSGLGILTDACDKFVIAGSAVCLVAGHDGMLCDVISSAKNVDEVRHAALEYTDGKTLSWDLLIYDRRSDSLVYLDNHGSTIRLGNVATSGSGGDIAQGVLDALPKPSGLPAAAKAAERAIRTAIRRNAACGGRVRVLSIPSSRKKPVLVK